MLCNLYYLCNSCYKDLSDFTGPSHNLKIYFRVWIITEKPLNMQAGKNLPYVMLLGFALEAVAHIICC